MAKDKKQEKPNIVFLNYDEEKKDFSSETYQFLRDLHDSGKAEKAVELSKKLVIKKCIMGFCLWSWISFGLIFFTPYFFRIMKLYQGIWYVDRFHRMRTDYEANGQIDKDDKKYNLKKWPFISLRILVAFCAWIPLLLSIILKVDALDPRERIVVPNE